MIVDWQTCIVVAVVVLCIAMTIRKAHRLYQSSKEKRCCCGCGVTSCKAKGNQEKRQMECHGTLKEPTKKA
jgi:hypothetical protein